MAAHSARQAQDSIERLWLSVRETFFNFLSKVYAKLLSGYYRKLQPSFALNKP